MCVGSKFYWLNKAKYVLPLQAIEFQLDPDQSGPGMLSQDFGFIVFILTTTLIVNA